MRTHTIALALFLAALAGCQNPPPPPPAGKATVSGSVSAKPRRGAESAGKGDYPKGGGPERVDYGKLQGIVVWLEADDAARTPPATARTTLGEKGFDPEVVAVSAGGELEVTNGTTGVATLFAEGAIDETPIAAGASAKVKLAKTGHVLAVVSELDAPRLRVLVAPTSHVAVLESGGSFSFTANPGDYVVKAWHWRLPAAEKRVKLEPGKNAEASLELSVDGLGKK